MRIALHVVALPWRARTNLATGADVDRRGIRRSVGAVARDAVDDLGHLLGIERPLLGDRARSSSSTAFAWMTALSSPCRTTLPSRVEIFAGIIPRICLRC